MPVVGRQHERGPGHEGGGGGAARSARVVERSGGMYVHDTTVCVVGGGQVGCGCTYTAQP